MEESGEPSSVEDGRRQTYRDIERRRSTREWMRGGCGVLRSSIAKLVTGMTWQFSIVLLVLIEVIINLILMLISFHAINDSEDHFASRLLHFVGISILAIFVFEVFLKLYALGFEYFKRERLEIFDAFVVMTAFTIEVILTATNASGSWKSLGFIIILRLWRVLRVITTIIAFREEFYELIDDELDAGKDNKSNEKTSTEKTERDSLKETKE